MMTLREIKEAPKPLYLTGAEIIELLSDVSWSDDDCKCCVKSFEPDDRIRVDSREDGGLDWTNESSKKREEGAECDD